MGSYKKSESAKKEGNLLQRPPPAEPLYQRTGNYGWEADGGRRGKWNQKALRKGAPMDNAKERRYAPLGCTRGDGARQEVDGATGHAGLDDSANATQSGV